MDGYKISWEDEKKLQTLRSIQERTNWETMDEKYRSEIVFHNNRKSYFKLLRKHKVEKDKFQSQKMVEVEYKNYPLKLGLNEFQFNEFILDEDFDFSKFAKQGKTIITPLLFAIRKGYLFLMKRIINKTNFDYFQFDILKEAIDLTSGGDVDQNVTELKVLETLLGAKHLNVSQKDSQKLFHYAVRYGKFSAMKMLISHPQISPFFHSLDVACKKGFKNIVEFLIFVDKRTNPLLLYSKCLQTAIYHQHVNVVKTLLRYPRTRIDTNENMALRLACKTKNKELIKMVFLHVDSFCSLEKSYNIAKKYGGRHFLFELVGINLEERKEGSKTYQKKEFLELANHFDQKIVDYVLKDVCGNNYSLALETLSDFKDERRKKELLTFFLSPPKIPSTSSSLEIKEIEQYTCPISLAIMETPVKLLETNDHYELTSLVNWFSYNSCDPMTGKTLESKKFEVNTDLQTKIQNWKKAQIVY